MFVTGLVERHSSLVYGVAYTLTGSTHLAEEVAQEVFALLAQKAQAFHRRQEIPRRNRYSVAVRC